MAGVSTWSGIRNKLENDYLCTALRGRIEGTLNNGCFDQRVFYRAFHLFDNQSIEESMNSDNPLVRVFALLDRRLGKRRLLTIEEKMEQELPWVRAFYMIRMQAEGLMETEEAGR